MSKKWLKVEFAAGDPFPQVEWIYGTHSAVTDQVIREFYDTVSLDLEDSYPDHDKRWQYYLKELRERENSEFIVFTFKGVPHSRSDMMLISNAALEKMFQRQRVGIKGKKKWVLAFVDDTATYRASQDFIVPATGSRDEIKNLVTAKVSRQPGYRHTASYSVREYYNPLRIVGHFDDICDSVAYGHGMTVAAVPLSDIPLGENRSSIF